MRDLVFDLEAVNDIQWWVENNKRLALKVFDLIKDIEKNPFKGFGKPEPLKYKLSGCWSRRIDLDNRIIYRVTEAQIIILQCRFHYD
jgi:toxin YoeB